MTIENFKIIVNETIGSVSVETVVPDNMIAMLVLAHGAGADMHHAFMKRLSRELADRSIGTLRFNFPFMENRKGRPDVAAVAEKTVDAAIASAQKLFPSAKIYAGGKSFGGRMTSNLLSKKRIDIHGLIFFGFPLHPPGKPSVDRGEHLSAVSVPMLFLQGTKDTLANVQLIEGVVLKLPLAKLMLFDGADHSFAIGKKDVLVDIVAATVDWIKSK